MAQPHLLPHMARLGWDLYTHTHVSVLRLFFLYALPLSVVPPAMIYYVGITYGGGILPALDPIQLQFIGIVFFVTELAMTFLMAWVIQRLGEMVDIQPTYEDAYKLAVVVPTPLWLAPLFLFIPSFILNLTVVSVAMMLSGILIFYSAPDILKIEEKGHAMLLSGSILAAGLVAWAGMMYLTLFTWSFVSSSLMLMI